MKKNVQKISDPDEFNRYLHHTSWLTWIILIAVTVVLVAFFAWACVFKIHVKVTGSAEIENGEISLHVEGKNAEKLKVGQKVVISDKEGTILSFNEDKSAVVSSVDLEDGTYTFTVVIEEKRPIEFLLGS